MPQAPTATLVARIEREAKQLANSGGISHSEALERLAVEAGYQDWHALLRAHSATVPEAERSRPREDVQVLARVPDANAAGEWLRAHGHTE